MKIQNQIAGAKQGIDAQKTGKVGGDQARSSSSEKLGALGNLGTTAQVNLSEKAQAMQKARDIATSDTVDEAKVARLQKLIDEGKYAVDARAVADRLVDEHLLMPE